jgi:hypothetical protein
VGVVSNSSDSSRIRRRSASPSKILPSLPHHHCLADSRLRVEQMYCVRHFLPLYDTPTLRGLTHSLFLSSSASPYFVFCLAIAFALLHRPWYQSSTASINPECTNSGRSIYCSVIIITLFSTSCYWSDRCLFDLNGGNIFTPRPPQDPRTVGVGVGWLRTLMGNRTWKFPCVGVRVVA